MCRLIIFILITSTTLSMAQNQVNTTEQILQQTIGMCVGDSARTMAALQEANKKIAELEKALKDKSDASSKPK